MARFRLLTANLLGDRVDPVDLASVLDRYRPDVVVIQELGPMAARLITDRYPYHDLRPGTEHKGRGIATRFEAGFGTIPLPWRDAGSAEIRLGPETVAVAGVHLVNPVDFPWWVAARHRREQVDALVEWSGTIPAGVAFLVAGDMNASPIWPVYRRLASLWPDLVAAHATSTGAQPAPTWGWRPGWPKILRIDHVFGFGLTAGSVTVAPVRGSDHATLVVDLDTG